MMLGGGGSNQAQHQLSLLIDPERLKNHIDSISKANEARKKSAEDHKKARSDALEVIKELSQKQDEHDNREQKLNEREETLDKLHDNINSKLEVHRSSLDAFSLEKAEFEAAKAEQQRIFKRMMDDALAKDQSANQKHQNLEMRAGVVAELEKAIKEREELVAAAERDIINFADKLLKTL